jgi:hypothetical protein
VLSFPGFWELVLAFVEGLEPENIRRSRGGREGSLVEEEAGGAGAGGDVALGRGAVKLLKG